MLKPEPTISVTFHFQDRNLNRREMRLRFLYSEEISIANLLSWIDTRLPDIQGISDSPIVKYELSMRFYDNAAPNAAEGSNAQIHVGLFYRDIETYDVLWLPSPLSEIFVTSGALSGVLVDAAHPAMSDWTDSGSLLLAGLVTPEGNPWPVEYVVGGKAV